METGNSRPFTADESEEPGSGLTGDVEAVLGPSVPRTPRASLVALLKVEDAAIRAATEAMAACPKCKGAGFTRADVAYGHPDFARNQKCSCRQTLDRAKRRRNVLTLSSLGEVRDKRFENFHTRLPGVQQAVLAAREYARNPDGWLVLLGPVGCGKTHLAAAVANACFDLDMVVLFVTVADLLDHLRATFAPSSTVSYDEQFTRMREADLLVLDDLGAQHSTDWAKEKLFQLINYRYNQSGVVDEATGRRRSATVITSNLFDLNGVEERIRSRLQDASISQLVTFGRDVQDYRPRKHRTAF